MKDYVPVLLMLISGLLLAVIGIKNKIPFWGGLLSSNIKIQLDKTDKVLALVALLSFLLAMILFAISH